jgi:predicted HTH transcriptional regulator
MFTIIFNRPKSDEIETKTRVKTREKIVRLISENKNVTINLLSEKTNVSLKTIEFHLSNLKKEGKIERLGADNGGYWIVKEVHKNK